VNHEAGIGIDVRDTVAVLVDLGLNLAGRRELGERRVEADVEPELVLDDGPPTSAPRS